MRRQHVDIRDTVRLVDSRYEDGTDVPHALARLVGDDDGAIADLVDLVQATSGRAVAERGDSPDFPRNVLVAGVPLAHVINAAFTYPAGAGRGGGRFSDERVGAWYAGESVAVARAEIEHHRRVFLVDAGITTAELSFTPYRADVSAPAAILDPRADRALLDPDSYARSQDFAHGLRGSGTGVVRYPSVRAKDGWCVAVLIPHLVQHVRRGRPAKVGWSDGRFAWQRARPAGSSS